MAARPKRGSKKREGRFNFKQPENTIAEIAAFEEFRREILPSLQKDLKEGLSAKEIRSKYQSLIQARQISAVFMLDDHAKAADVANNILNRIEGKPTETKEVKHKFEDLKDVELDSVLDSMLDDVDNEESEVSEIN